MEEKTYQITAVIGLIILFICAIGSYFLLGKQLTWREICSFSWFGEESLYNDALLGKRQFVSLNGGFHKLIHSKVIRDADVNQMIVKTQDDSLTSIVWQYDVETLAASVVNFGKWLEAKDIDFCYVQAPYKILPNYTEIPVGITDYSNINADKFLSVLAENKIDYLDLRAGIAEEDKDRKGLFYRTDHHWQTKTAFWAFSHVGKMLSKQYGWQIPESYLALESYSITSYPNSFLGSQGKRVGQLYAGLDQYDFIAPAFSTEFTVEIEKADGSERVQQGDFCQALIYHPLLTVNSDVEDNKYACYFGGDYPVVKVKNHLITNGKKVLVVKDSFALPFSAFLSTIAQEVHMIDLRYFTESVEDYILAYQPDTVMMLYNPSSFGSSQMFQVLSQP